jgi:hypothetical protein
MLFTLFDRAIPEILPDFPARIDLICHYGRGDLWACRDFPVLKRQVDNVKGAIASSRGGVKIDLEIDPKTGMPADLLPRIPKQRELKVSDGGEPHSVSVTFRDTSLLVVDGGKGSLDAIGDLVGLSKIDLPAGYDKSRMDRFMRDHLETFKQYLGRDLEIPILFYRRIKAVFAELGLTEVPLSLGAAAVSVFLNGLKDQVGADGDPITRETLFGIEKKTTTDYASNGKYITRARTEMVQARRKNETRIADSYHGGRTETYETGPSRPGEDVHDIDMMSAYPSAQGAIRVPDYAASFTTTDPADFTAGVLGSAEVEFWTPAHVRCPPIVIQTDHGLMAPLTGVAMATAPEIATAIHLGVKIQIRHGVVIPWTKDEVRPFEIFVRTLIETRNKRKKVEVGPDGTERRVDTLESLVIKTVTNSLYGKTAQAVHPRNVFDSRTGRDRALSPSAVSNAAFAAFTTGLVRAALAEMMNSIPVHRLVISASTDGFMTTATIDEIDATGPACRVLSESRRRITGDPCLLEYKQHAMQVVTARSRGAFTAVVSPGSKPILAKAGIKVPRDEPDQNDFLLGMYLDRTIDTVNPREDLVAFRVQWIGDTDLVSVERHPRINLEPDHKRKLVNPRMVRIVGGPHAGREHLATSSVPHETVEAMMEERALFEGWRRTTGQCLKDMARWDDWQDYRDSTLAARGAGKRPHRTAGGSADDLKRQFVRALVRGDWSVGIGRQSYREVAEWLTGAGYPTSVDALKNATRPAAGLIEHSIARTEKTVELLAVILGDYPEFEFWRAFVHDQLARVRADPRIARRLKRADAA